MHLKITLSPFNKLKYYNVVPQWALFGVLSELGRVTGKQHGGSFPRALLPGVALDLETAT